MLDTIIGSGAPGIEGIERKAKSPVESQATETPMSPKLPNLTTEDIQGYLSKAAPTQLVPQKLWQNTLFQTLSICETLPCPFLVKGLLEEIRPTSEGILDHSGETYLEAVRRSIQERRYFDPLLDKALVCIANLPTGSIPENLAFILGRLGENLALPQIEIGPAAIRQLQAFQQRSLDARLFQFEAAGFTLWPPWGGQTIEAMMKPQFSLDNSDIGLLESGGTGSSASERKWFKEAHAAKNWFLKWRKAPPLPHLSGQSLVWDTRKEQVNQQDGGLETLVPKGTLENLLPSELLWIGETANLFSWKWSQGELLYFGREQSTALRPSLCWNLVWDEKVLDWQYWHSGCPGRMGSMALGWIISVLETIIKVRGPFDFETRWILAEKPGTDWEHSVKPLKRLVKSLWPNHTHWERFTNPKGSYANHPNQTHQCWIRFGCPETAETEIQLHPQKLGSEQIPAKLTLVGTPQSPEDWLEWDERVMNDLGHYWIPIGDKHEAK